MAVVWLWQSASTIKARDKSAELVTYARIGDLPQHSQKAIMLDGMPIRYHGHVTGPTWQSTGDLTAAELGTGAAAADDSE